MVVTLSEADLDGQFLLSIGMIPSVGARLLLADYRSGLAEHRLAVIDALVQDQRLRP